MIINKDIQIGGVAHASGGVSGDIVTSSICADIDDTPPLIGDIVECSLDGGVEAQYINGRVSAINFPSETDPTVPRHVKQITEDDIAKWNAYQVSLHDHSNIDILNSTTAVFTSEQASKLEALNKYDDTEINDKVTELGEAIQSKADKGEIPSKTSQLENDSGYLTEHQPLNGYATEQWVTEQKYIKEHQSLAEYYNKEQTETLLDSALSLKADKSELPAIPQDISAFNNDIGYLTEHQSISHKADKSEIPSKVSQLENDSGYLNTHQDISHKADASALLELWDKVRPHEVYDCGQDTGLLGLNIEEDSITGNNWQLTGLDLSQFARLKFYIKSGGDKLSRTRNTPPLVIEMFLDSRAAQSGGKDASGHFFAQAVGYNMNDPNVQFRTSVCVSSDKTKILILDQSSLYSTTLGDRNDNGRWCYKIEGYKT